MSPPEIYLIAPADIALDTLVSRLDDALLRPAVAAILPLRGDRSEADYRALVAAIVPKAQAAGVAVVIEGEPARVREWGADGLHVTGGIRAVKTAIAALKPDFIVGAGSIRTRDDAMQAGEAGVDYILFGPLSGPISRAERELARWWAETMEVPSILSDPEADFDRYDAEGCEFIGLGILAGAPVR